MVALVNEARSQGYRCGDAGLHPPVPPLALDARLSLAAQKHSADMRARGGAGSHSGSDGSRAADRVGREGYKPLWLGENTYWNLSAEPRPGEAMNFWLLSPAHCRNLMSPNFSDLGVGKAGGYWTLVFARPL